MVLSKELEKYVRPPAKHKRRIKKVCIDNPYNKLNQVSDLLIKLLPESLLTCEEKTEYKGIRVWRNEYGGVYEYQGQYYQESFYIGYECEIIGTENLDITDRLKIHQEFYNLYRCNYDIEKSMDVIKSKWRL